MMPSITSQFLRRDKGDRPPVIPERTKNFAFVGQYCELPDDVVFTVEYSVWSAQTAVYRQLGLKRPVLKSSKEITIRAFCSKHSALYMMSSRRRAKRDKASCRIVRTAQFLRLISRDLC
jgi:myosin-crossreactive antigen